VRRKSEEMVRTVEPLVTKRIPSKDRVGREYPTLRELSQELQNVIYGPAKKAGVLVVTIALEPE
jgi:hypothetical protein